MNRGKLIVIALALLFGILTCSDHKTEKRMPQIGTKPSASSIPIYKIAVHPLHNPGKLIQAYQPLVDYINSRVQGACLSLEASRDYASFEEKYLARKPEFLLPNPWQTLQAMKVGYRVVAMAGEPQDFKGIFVVRKDSSLKSPSDLKGKIVSYPSPTALAACIMPQFFLHSHGINVNSDIENRYVGSQESSIMNAYLGKTAAGATWPPPWRAFLKEHPREAAELKVLWETESLVNNSVMVRDDVPNHVVEQVRELLLGLDGKEEGKLILAVMETARFLSSSNEDYDVARQYISCFEKEVRQVNKQ